MGGGGARTQQVSRSARSSAGAGTLLHPVRLFFLCHGSGVGVGGGLCSRFRIGGRGNMNMEHERGVACFGVYHG